MYLLLSSFISALSYLRLYLNDKKIKYPLFLHQLKNVHTLNKNILNKDIFYLNYVY